VIAVTDSGCGIPQDEIPNLTEPFYMVDKSRSRAAGGAGLGLSLVAQIMQLHGGRVGIESKEGAGTTVKLHFIYTSLNT
jgi:two-component system phosphate regulon sensor histidine kinase PhoR